MVIRSTASGKVIKAQFRRIEKDRRETMSQLAIHGEKPVRSTKLPYGKQKIEQADIDAVVQVLQSDLLTTGPAVVAFEEAVADYVGANYAVAFANGTAALHAACFAADIQPGDEVITSPLTFAASANCVLYQRGVPVFADIDETTWNIDPIEIEKKITPKTKAIIPVDFTGKPVEMDEINEIAKKHSLIVIQDSAHALGAIYNNQKVGSIADMTEFSFHPVKHITTGEGGMITTNRKDLYEKLKRFVTHGITRDPSQMSENQGPWFYQQLDLGYNYRITDIQCTLGISQLSRMDENLKRRHEIVAQYQDAFGSMEGVSIPQIENLKDSAWHLYILKLNLEELATDRKVIYEALQAENIGVNVHYIPVYWHPYYQQLGYEKGLCPKAEALYEQIITLPLFSAMSDEDVLNVVEAIKKVISFYRKCF